jgi:hypothetical protein
MEEGKKTGRVQPKSTHKERVVYRDGMLEMRNWQGMVETLLAMFGSLFPGCKKLDQVAIDVVNVWRYKIAKSATGRCSSTRKRC